MCLSSPGVMNCNEHLKLGAGMVSMCVCATAMQQQDNTTQLLPEYPHPAAVEPESRTDLIL
jgi:hypothetical protein